MSLNTAHEIEILKSQCILTLSNYIHLKDHRSPFLEAIKDYGTVNADGNSSVAYGTLFDKTANTRTP